MRPFLILETRDSNLSNPQATDAQFLDKPRETSVSVARSCKSEAGGTKGQTEKRTRCNA